MATFDRAHSTFLQISSEVDTGSKAEAVRKTAYAALKGVATRFRSLRLASLAATVRTAEGGHFDKVIVMIDKMIETLRKEEQEDIRIGTGARRKRTSTRTRRRIWSTRSGSMRASLSAWKQRALSSKSRSPRPSLKLLLPKRPWQRHSHSGTRKARTSRMH